MLLEEQLDYRSGMLSVLRHVHRYHPDALPGVMYLPDVSGHVRVEGQFRYAVSDHKTSPQRYAGQAVVDGFLRFATLVRTEVTASLAHDLGQHGPQDGAGIDAAVLHDL